MVNQEQELVEFRPVNEGVQYLFRHMDDGVQYLFKFPNGHGASIIKTQYSYGGRAGLYELAVLDANDHLDYTTEITNDVLGWLSPEKVKETLIKISKL